MNKNKTNGENENSERRFRDILFDNLKKTAATRGNELFLDALNRFFDWLRDEGGPKLYKFLNENAGLFLDALFSKGSASLKATRIIAEHEENQRLLNLANNIEKQYEIIDVITTRLSEDNLLYEIIDLFTRPVDCPHYHYKTTVNWYDYISSKSSTDKSMGIETFHYIEADEITCSKCKGLFTVNGFICEYPESTYDSHRLSAFAI